MYRWASPEQHSHPPFQEQHSHGAAGTEVEQQVSPERQIADAENRCD